MPALVFASETGAGDEINAQNPNGVFCSSSVLSNHRVARQALCTVLGGRLYIDVLGQVVIGAAHKKNPEQETLLQVLEVLDERVEIFNHDQAFSDSLVQLVDDEPSDARASIIERLAHCPAIARASRASSSAINLPDVDWLLGDRGHNADWFKEVLKDKGIHPCIPSRKQRKAVIRYDKRRDPL